MKKNCVRCNRQFTTSHPWRGNTRAKYCVKCKAVVRKEQQQKSEAKRKEKEYPQAIETDLAFYGYKEPLTKFANGYGYVGVVRYNKTHDKVECHFCGKLFKNVGSHAYFSHGLKAVEYKEKTGLAQKTALVGEGTRTSLILAHKEIPSFSQRNKSPEQVKAHMVAMSKRADKKRNRVKWTLERRNENGNCPEQLIDRIKKLHIKLGKRPTAKEYQIEYGSFQSIMTVYGTWNKALAIAKISTYTDEKNLRSDPQFLLEHLRQFYRKYGRTARTSDMRRGLVPNHQIYCKVFGTLNAARQLAGVPVIIPISKYRWDEVIIKAKA